MMAGNIHFDVSLGRLSIKGECTIYQAAEVKAAMVSAFANQQFQELDLSGVTELDSAGLQLIILAHRTAKSRGQTLAMKRPGNAVQTVLESVMLHDVLTGNNGELHS